MPEEMYNTRDRIFQWNQVWRQTLFAGATRYAIQNRILLALVRVLSKVILLLLERCSVVDFLREPVIGLSESYHRETKRNTEDGQREEAASTLSPFLSIHDVDEAYLGWCMIMSRQPR